MRRALLLLAISLLGATGLMLLRRAGPEAAPPVELGGGRSTGTLHRAAARALPETATAARAREPSARVEAGAETAALVVRLLDGAGAPAAGLELRLAGADGPARTDAEGRARMVRPADACRLSVHGALLSVLPPSELDTGSPPAALAGLHGEELDAVLDAELVGAAGNALELHLRHEHWLVRATVRAPDGAPLRSERLHVTPNRLGTARPCVATTGAAGELVLALWIKSGNLGDRSALVLRRMGDEESDHGEEHAYVALELFKAPTRGQLALDVTLRARDLIVAGRFEDPEGSPEAGRLFLEQLGETDAGPSWRPFSCEVDQQGSHFEVHGTAPAAALRLVPSFGGRAREPIEFVPGTDDLIVVIESYGELRGRVLLDPGVDCHQLELALHRRDAHAPPRPARWGDGATFVASELEPGSWDLVVSAGRRAFARVEGITVAGALPSFDARLAPLDLRGRLRPLELRVVDEHGEPAKGVRVHALDDAGAHELGRRAQLVLWRAVPLDLLVSADGKHEVVLRGVDEDRSVRLGPGLEVELTIEGLPQVHGTPQWQVLFRPSPKRVATGIAHRVDAVLDEDGRARARLDAPGTWEVELHYARHGQWTFFQEGASIGQVEVREAVDEQRFRLAVPADYLERAGR